MKLILLLFVLSISTAFATDHWVYNDFPVNKKQMENYFDNVINKGRVQVYKFKKDIKFTDLPSSLAKKVKTIDLKKQLPFSTNIAQNKDAPSTKITELTSQLTVDRYKKALKWVTAFGPRSTEKSRKEIIKTLQSFGYKAFDNYNIEAFKKGEVEPEKFIILEAHMDTVRNTMGADDNGSGTAALLEAARILKDVPTKYSILFLVTEHEEIGLKGSRYKVKELIEKDEIKDLLFVANMDMIAYRENNRFDIETEPEHEELAAWVAQQALKYTSLEPNILLHAWGADHVPFLQAGVPAILTIEHWNTHNPCYHKTCDNLELVDWDYAVEIARLNIALVALKAELI